MRSLRSDVGPLLSGLFHLTSSFFFLLFPFFFRETFFEGKASVPASLETLRHGNELRL